LFEGFVKRKPVQYFSHTEKRRVGTQRVKVPAHVRTSVEQRGTMVQSSYWIPEGKVKSVSTIDTVRIPEKYTKKVGVSFKAKKGKNARKYKPIKEEPKGMDMFRQVQQESYQSRKVKKTIGRPTQYYRVKPDSMFIKGKVRTGSGLGAYKESVKATEAVLPKSLPISRSTSRFNPLSASRPITSGKPITGARPFTNLRPNTQVRPMSEVRPMVGVRPLSKARTVTKVRPIQEVRPITKIRPVQKLRPVVVKFPEKKIPPIRDYKLEKVKKKKRSDGLYGGVSKYNPSLYAVYANIRGPRPDVLTGVGVRPL
jgi:hypothetical protein